MTENKKPKKEDFRYLNEFESAEKMAGWGSQASSIRKDADHIATLNPENPNFIKVAVAAEALESAIKAALAWTKTIKYYV